MKHELDTLDSHHNPELAAVEHLQDRSELSSLYPKAKTKWKGELIAADERAERREQAALDFGKGIRKDAVVIGMLAALPLLFAATVLIIIGNIEVKANEMLYLILPGIILALLAMWLVFALFRKIGEIFSTHGMQVLPFYGTHAAYLLLGITTAYSLTRVSYRGDTMSALFIVGGVAFILSIVFSIVILYIWTERRMSSSFKKATLLIIATALTLAAAITTIVAI